MRENNQKLMETETDDDLILKIKVLSPVKS